MQDTDEIIIEQFANKIVELGVQTPAVFFLELHKPVCTLAHTGTLLLEPIATPFFGTERINKLKTLLSDRKNIDELIDKIEIITKNGTR